MAPRSAQETLPPAAADVDPLVLDTLIAGGELHAAAHGRSTRASGTAHREPERQGPERQEARTAPEEQYPALRSALLDSYGIRHGFSTRLGGVSTVYRDTPASPPDLNLGFTASDPHEHVLANRERLLRYVFGETRPLVTLRQRHTSLLLRSGIADCLPAGANEAAARVGDAHWTTEPGFALGVQSADCVPILISDRANRVVAAFHAGWRGTLRRIVENGIGRLRTETGVMPGDLVAAIGPSIRACCYAIGEEVESEFHSQFAYADELFFDVYDTDPVRKKYPMLFLTQRAPGHSDLGPSRHLDLAEANRRQLLDAGLGEESVEVFPQCTSCRADLFFSHRAQHGFTGRMLNVIAVGES